MSAGTASTPQQGMSKRSQVVISLAVAIVLIVSAWWISGREGIGDLGSAGMNASLLPSVGDAAPDFTVYDLNGNPRKLSDYAGQPVWLNFWGSWCPPCRAEMPDLQAAYAQLQPQGVVMLAISLDESATQAGQFAQRNGVTFTVLSDPDRSATGQAYPIVNFPTHVFINRDGTINSIALKTLSTEDALGYAQKIIDS